MGLKRVAKGAAARLPRKSDYTKEFEKDWKALQHAGRNLAALQDAITLLIANQAPLPAEWSDHPLKGEWQDHRECHAGGDLLLIYRIHGEGTVIFVRAGTHSELFK